MLINLAGLLLAGYWGVVMLGWAFTESAGYGFASFLLLGFAAICGINVWNILSGEEAKWIDDAIKKKLGYKTTCSICDKEMSSRALVCPHCGHPNPQE